MSRLRYAGFRKRFLASALDCVVLGLPLTVIWISTYRHAVRASLTAFVAWRVGWPIAFAALHLWLLVRFGGTPGKLMVGIRVIRTNGAPLAWKNAIMRNSIDLIYTAYGLWLFFYVLPRIDFPVVSAMTWKQIGLYWKQLYPQWTAAIAHSYTAFWMSEAFFMLTNRSRKAIQDFLGDTVVVDLICPGCGSSFSFYAKFCDSCGRALSRHRIASEGYKLDLEVRE